MYIWCPKNQSETGLILQIWNRRYEQSKFRLQTGSTYGTAVFKGSLGELIPDRKSGGMLIDVRYCRHHINIKYQIYTKIAILNPQVTLTQVIEGTSVSTLLYSLKAVMCVSYCIWEICVGKYCIDQQSSCTNRTKQYINLRELVGLKLQFLCISGIWCVCNACIMLHLLTSLQTSCLVSIPLGSPWRECFIDTSCLEPKLWLLIFPTSYLKDKPRFGLIFRASNVHRFWWNLANMFSTLLRREGYHRFLKFSSVFEIWN